METTEKIAESYCRYVRGWFTLPNLRCPGQNEIDLLAVDVATKARPIRYHIECGVSVSGAYSKLTAKPFSIEQLRTRVMAAGQRRTIDFFIQRKFEPPAVIETLGRYGFAPGSYRKVIVTWGWTDQAATVANRHGIELWDFRELLREIADSVAAGRTYFTDDTLRTLHLFTKAGAVEPR